MDDMSNPPFKEWKNGLNNLIVFKIINGSSLPALSFAGIYPFTQPLDSLIK
jgi:hypothetical protein